MKNTVSVIIPAYNARKYIHRSVNSILAQTYDDLEIFIVDDYSTDGTLDYTSELFSDNEKIFFLRNERRKGPSGARNTGLLRAKGEYFAFLDADDSWCPCHLEKGIGTLAGNKDIDALFFDFNIVDDVTGKVKTNWFSEKKFTKLVRAKMVGDNVWLITDNLFTALLEESFIQLQSLIVKRRSCGNILFDENIKRAEDLDFIVKLFLENRTRFAYSGVITNNYYRREGSLTAQCLENSTLTLIDHVYLFQRYLNHHKNDKTIVHKLKRILYEKHLDLSYCYRKKSDHIEAFRHLIKSLQYGNGGQQLEEFLKISVSVISRNAFRNR